MIRLADISDSPRIAEIYRFYVENTAITFDEKTPTPRSIAEKIEALRSMYPFIVLEEEGLIHGFAYLSPYRPHSAYRWSVENSVYLHPDSRGRGRGTRLLSVLIQLARLQGFATMYAVIAPPNPESIRLHEKLGFRHLACFTKTAFKAGSWRSIEWMELRLLPPEVFIDGTIPSEPLPFATVLSRFPDEVASILGG